MKTRSPTTIVALLITIIGSFINSTVQAQAPTWTVRDSGTTANLYAVTQAGGSDVVAVGAFGTFRHSADAGATWSGGTTGPNDLFGVTYTGSRVVAVGDNGRRSLSDDHGSTWTTDLTGPTSGANANFETLNAVCYGGEVMAVGDNGTIKGSSDAGQTWNVRTSNTTQHLRGIAVGNNAYVAVGDNGTTCRSTNGGTWTVTTVPSPGNNNDFRAITWTGTQFVAVGGDASEMAAWTSTDGTAWTLASSIDARHCVTWTGWRVVAGGISVQQSSTGSTAWQQSSRPTTDQVRGLATVPGAAVVAVALQGGIATTPDMLSTMQVTLAVSAQPGAGGTVGGGGSYAPGTSVTATAQPAPGYYFVNWTESSTVVSTSQSYTFALNSSRSLVANFATTGTELLQNGSFAAGLNYWNLDPTLGDWSPLNGTELSLHPTFTGYSGDLVYQPLNVTGAANKTVVAKLDLRKVFAPAGLSTIAVYVEYVDTSDVLHHVKAFDAANDSITDVAGNWTTVQGIVVLPANARKITRLSIAKQTNGQFIGDNASLTALTLTPGAVPQVTGIISSGAYDSTMTINGLGFGSTAGSVRVGGSSAGLAVQTWTNTVVTALLQDPVQTGVVRVVQDFTESWGDFTLNVTAPHFTLGTTSRFVEVIKGGKAHFVIGAQFFNGYAPVAGVNFTVPENTTPGVCTFSPVPIMHSGGVQLTIDTTTLAPGLYFYTVQSVAAGSAPRSIPITLRVSAAASAKFFFGGTEVTSINRSVQGELETFYYQASDSTGRLLPIDECVLSSTNPSVVEVFHLSSNGFNRVCVLNEGGANLQVTAPDGFTASLPVTVSGMSAHRVSMVGLSPMMPNNSGSMQVFFAAFAAGGTLSGVGAEGLLPTVGNTGVLNGTWSGGNTSYNSNFIIDPTALPGVFLFSASTSSGNKLFNALKVVNSPQHGSISGEIHALVNTVPTGAEGTLEFYAPGNSAVPVVVREINNYMGPSYSAGGFPAGSYKVRWVPGFQVIAPQWYPNAPTFADAQVLDFVAGTTVTNVDFFPSSSDLMIVQQPAAASGGVGGSVQFTVQTTGGTEPITYHWQKDQVDLTEQFGRYEGTLTNTLTIKGLIAGDNGSKYRVVVTDSSGVPVLENSWEALLTVGSNPPLATTKATTFVSATRAVLAGDVNAQGLDSEVDFLWGETAAALTHTIGGVPALATGSSVTPVSAQLTNLTPNKTYFYRVSAHNVVGTTLGTVMSFKTPVAVPPAVTTLAVTPGSIKHNEAELNGTVNARSAATQVIFEYGRTTSYGSMVQADTPIVTGNSATAVKATPTGLLPHTKYNYRVKGVSDNGSATGTNLTFTTLNRTPETQPNSFGVLIGSTATLNVLGNDSDPDGDTLTITSFTQPVATAGTVAKVGANLVFTPKSTFNGGTFNYTVSDGFGGSHSNTVTLTLVGNPTLSPQNRDDLTSNGITYDVSITTTANWSVTESLAWASASPLAGSGNGVVSITVQPNTTKLSRVGNVTIGGVQHRITQAGVMAPGISLPATIPTGIVSGTYSLPIPTVNGPVSYVVTGLPKGLSMAQATGVIGGKPQAFGDFPVTVKASNASGTTPVISFTLHIIATPASARGNFTALIPRNAKLNDGFGGLLSFNATTIGSLSGTLKLGNPAALPFVGQLEVPLSGSPIARVVVPRAGKPSLLIDLTLNSGSVGRLAATLSEDTSGGESVLFGGYRHSWTMNAPAGKFAGRYTAEFEQPINNPNVPQGSGFVALTVDAMGLANWSGKFADGTPYTGSATLWPTGDIPMFQMLYSGKGSVLGTSIIVPQVAPDPERTLTGSLSWSKQAQAVRPYPLGFGPIILDVMGGDYIPPEEGQIVNGLPDVAFGQVNASIGFSLGGIDAADQFEDLDQDFRFTSAGATIFSSSTVTNPAKVKIISLSVATGVFSGTATLTDPVNVSREVTFDGVLLNRNQSGSGFFLLPQMPTPPSLNTTTTQQNSGLLSID
jgi:hypothetical protein